MTKLSPIRVVLVDDHHCVLWGLEKLIEGERPRMEVVGKARTSTEALALVAQTAPDIVLLDLDLGGENTVEIIPLLTARAPTRVLVLTGKRDPKVRDAAIVSGACGVLDKTDGAETILKAINKIHQGELWLDRSTTARVFVELSKPKSVPEKDIAAERLKSLTAREREVVEHLVSDPGTDNRRLAKKLNVGEHTLRNHLSHIYDKVGVPNRLELYLFAQRHALIKQAV